MKPTTATALREAAAENATVTVTRTDGRTFTGTAKAHPTEPDVFTVATGRRGRPALIHADDVEDVIFE